MKLENYSRDELDHAIEQWVICRRNCERNRAILRRLLFDGVTQEQIAEEFGLAPRTVQYIIDKTEKQLFRHL